MTSDTVRIDQPGIYDIPDATYHADPVPGGSLSSTGARKLLPPSCPALFRHYADSPPKPSREFNIGHAAHLLVLGAGPVLVVVDAENWQTKAAREQRDEAHEAGKVPLLRREHDTVQAMAAALRRHRVAAAVFNPEGGAPEQSAFWVDPETDVWCRARYDWLPAETHRRRILADYKSCLNAAPNAIQRSVNSYGYHQQADFYLTGAATLGLGDTAFVFVFQEKTPPYLVSVIQLDEAALRIGHELNRRAIDIYQRCVETGRWPGYSDDVEVISLPAWVERRHDEDLP